jgi:hypothetical protein
MEFQTGRYRHLENLTLGKTDHFDKMIITQLHKKSLANYEIRSVITVFRRSATETV